MLKGLQEDHEVKKKILAGHSKIFLRSLIPPLHMWFKAPADKSRHFVSFSYLESKKYYLYMSLFQANVFHDIYKGVISGF